MTQWNLKSALTAAIVIATSIAAVGYAAQFFGLEFLVPDIWSISASGADESTQPIIEASLDSTVEGAVTLCDPSAGGCDFTISPDSPFSGLDATFTVMINGGLPPFQCSILFGDGSSVGPVTCQTGQQFVHAYNSKGVEHVQLRVADSTQSFFDVFHDVTVQGQDLLVGFDWGPVALTAGKPVTFTPSIIGGTQPYTFSWDFGDGTAGTSAPVQHAYATKGSHPVTLTVTDANGVTARSQAKMIVFAQTLTANIAPTQAAPTAGKETTVLVSFSGGTTPYIFTLDWGDGTGSPPTTYPLPSALILVSHTYAAKSIAVGYKVMLKVQDANDQLAIATQVIIVSPQPLVASVNCPDMGLTVAKPFSCDVDATGGTPPYQGTGPQPVSGFSTKGGTFPVSFTVTDANGASATGTDYVIIDSQPLVVTASCVNGTTGKPITCTASATGGTEPYTFEWRFRSADQTISYGSSSGQTAQFIFSSKGIYSAEVTVKDANSPTSPANMVKNPVFVQAQIVAITATCSTGALGQPIQCDASATGGTAPYLFTWDVGKDGTIDGQGPKFHPSLPTKGTFSIEATVVDQNGDRDSVNIPVTSSGTPLKVAFSMSPTVPTASKPVTFFADVSGGTPPYRVIWSIASLDANLQKQKIASLFGNPVTYTFPVKGPYSVGVTVIDANKAVATIGGPVPLLDPSGNQVGFIWHISHIITGGTSTGNVTTGGEAMLDTIAILDLTVMTQGGSMRSEMIRLQGPVHVMWGPLGDHDSDGLLDIQTEIVSMQLTGNSEIFGNDIVLSLADKTFGLLEQVSAQPQPDPPFPADSFFDVFYELDVPNLGDRWITDGPIHVDSMVTDPSIPLGSVYAPNNVDIQVDAQPLVAEIVKTTEVPTVGKPHGLSAQVSGGTAPYAFHWNVGQDATIDGRDQDFTFVPTTKGDFLISLTVTDANGVSRKTEVTQHVIGQNFVAIMQCPTTVTAGKPFTCDVSATGGTPPYTNTGPVPFTFQSKGSFAVEFVVHDSNGDLARTGVIVTINPQPLAITATCSDGTAGKPVQCDASASGGTAPYAFSWDADKDGSIEAQGETAQFIFPTKGTHTIDAIVTDFNGDTAQVNIPVAIGPQPLVVQGPFVKPDNPTSDKPIAAYVLVSGGTPPYQTLWSVSSEDSAGVKTPIQVIQGNPIQFMVPTKGMYSLGVTVVDANGKIAINGGPIPLYDLSGNLAGLLVYADEHVTDGTTHGDLQNGGDDTVTLQAMVDLSMEVRPMPKTPVMVMLTGTAVVHRGAAMDTDGDGLPDTVPIELVSLDLKGDSPLLGPVHIMQSSTMKSRGQIVGTSPYFFPADSFFDIFVEISLGDNILHNSDPVMFQGPINSIPPIGSDFHPKNVPFRVAGQTLTISAQCGTSTNIITAGKPFDCQATASGGTGPYIFYWDVGKDGIKEANVTSTFTTAFPVKGTHSIDASVLDANGAFATINLPINVAGQPLISGFTYTPTVPTSGKPITFIATASGGTPPYQFIWNLGDGSSEQGDTITHTFAVKGSYSVLLTVRDSNGLLAAFTQIVIVKPQPLIVDFDNTSGKQDIPVTFTAVVSGGTVPYAFSWNFGDGSPAGSGNPVAHGYATGGTFNVTVTVRDNNNATATAAHSITFFAHLASADFTPTKTLVGTTIFTSTIVGGTPPVACTWTFGDGTPAQTGCGHVTHTYTVAGTFTVTLTVHDGNNDVVSVTHQVTVENGPELIRGKVHWTHQLTGGVGATQNFVGKVRNPSSLTVLATLKVDIFTDGGVFVASVSCSISMAPGSTNLAFTCPWVATITGKFTFTATLLYSIDFGDGQSVTGIDGSKSGTFTVLP